MPGLKSARVKNLVVQPKTAELNVGIARYLFVKRGPQPKRLFNATQCQARAALARSIARVVTDPKLKARLENQAAKLDERASGMNAQKQGKGPVPA